MIQHLKNSNITVSRSILISIITQRLSVFFFQVERLLPFILQSFIRVTKIVSYYIPAYFYFKKSAFSDHHRILVKHNVSCDSLSLCAFTPSPLLLCMVLPTLAPMYLFIQIHFSEFPNLHNSLCLLNCRFRSKTSQKPTGAKTRCKIRPVGTGNFEGLCRQQIIVASITWYMTSESRGGKLESEQQGSRNRRKGVPCLAG